MDSTLSSLSQELDALRELRKFPEAIQILDTLSESGHLSTRDRLFVTSEKAQLFYDQGYFHRAERVLHDGLEWSKTALNGSWLLEERSLLDLLAAKNALTMVQTKGDGRHACKVWREIVLSYCPGEVIDVVPDAVTVFPFFYSTYSRSNLNAFPPGSLKSSLSYGSAI